MDVDSLARFFIAPDRNINGSLYNNGKGEIHHYIRLTGGDWLSFGRTNHDLSGQSVPSHLFISETGNSQAGGGAILLVWFTDPVSRIRKRLGQLEQGMDFVDDNGNVHKSYGVFATLSFDEGKIWSIRKIIPTDPLWQIG